ncbi:MAG: ArsC/Spx/MgsR family protein [Candidatus Poseidoniaceae archaeon]|jgi:arsenate reductase|nr:ArsC/Spx/MgsR family protein [Candidatus Poseidoniaceae archaeon]
MRLYHNPRCSKSRQAHAILTARGIEFEDYRYLEVGISKEDIGILSNLPNVVRTNEKEFQNSKDDLADAKIVAKLLLSTPKLLQRPILVSNHEAVIGRPPDLITKLLP